MQTNNFRSLVDKAAVSINQTLWDKRGWEFESYWELIVYYPCSSLILTIVEVTNFSSMSNVHILGIERNLSNL